MPDTPKQVLILGASGLAVEAAELAEQLPGHAVAGFVQNLWPERRGETIEGLPLYYIDEIASLAATHVAVCASGNRTRIGIIEQAAQLGIRFTTLVHPRAVVSPRSRLSEGVIVAAGAVAGTRTTIGRHVMISRNSSIGHDTIIEDYVFIGPGAHIAGACKIEQAAFIGIGAVVRDHLTIGKNSVLGAGATAVRNIPADFLLPAQIR